MTQKRITLQGNRYSGEFSAYIKMTKRREEPNYCGIPLRDLYHWWGIGEIKDTQTNETHEFCFITLKKESVWKKIERLEDGIIEIKGEWGEQINPPIIKKEALCDIVLKQMYEDTIKKGKCMPIPWVFPDSLNYEGLLKKGIIADKKSWKNL